MCSHREVLIEAVRDQVPVTGLYSSAVEMVAVTRIGSVAFVQPPATSTRPSSNTVELATYLCCDSDSVGTNTPAIPPGDAAKKNKPISVTRLRRNRKGVITNAFHPTKNL